MALVNPQAAVITGLNATLAQPTTSETIVPQAGAIYVVVVYAATNTTRYIGGLVPDLADPSTGLITVTFSQVTNVTAGLIYT